ncbi:MAG: hypothetical protein H0X40_06885 [Chthoniobacterales bacterium]|nr:hypothetical protein [Chthoniobacterales bacterium]
MVAVIAAVFFGLIQARQFRVQRRDAAAAELVRSFQDAQFTRASTLISALPANGTARVFCAAGQE